MTRLVASIASASLLALAACNAPKKDEAPTAETPTVEAPAVDTATTDPMAAPPADAAASVPTDPAAVAPPADEGSPGNAGNDKGRPN